MENAEIDSLIKALGLSMQRKYTTPEELKTLRYGKVRTVHIIIAQQFVHV